MKPLCLHELPSPRYLKSARQLIRFLNKFYDIPRKPKLRIDPKMLKRHNALGLYLPYTETIVLMHDKIESERDLFVIFIEFGHHMSPGVHHVGE